ncbi:MAG: hypothetical protein AB7G28_11405 [Pirellulales bacterium]
MRQLAEQVRQVAIVYATQIRSWIWALAVILFAFMFLAFVRADDRSLTIIPLAFCYSQFFGAWIVDQAKHQFAHSRSRLLPEFNVAHLIVPLAFILTGAVVCPALLAAIKHSDPLPYAAIISISMAVILLGRFFPQIAWLVAIAVISAIWLTKDSGRETNIANALFQPVMTIPLFFLGWLGIGFYFFKLCRLAEDETIYQLLSDETQKVTADGAEGQTRAKYRNAARWWAISDRWHAKIGGFHQFRRRRIIRLLGYGFSATPVELTAIGWAIFMTIVVGWIVIDTDDPYDITRSTDAIFLLVPALFASMAPIAVAGSAIGCRVPRLKNEVLFPLTRRELIDDLLLASAWQSLVIWLLGCISGLAILLYALPTDSKTATLFITAAMLTGATAIAAYGLSLHIVMIEVKLAQFFILGLFVLAFGTLMVTWWSSREVTGDMPYWIVAAIVFGGGLLMTRTARESWLNLELG